jgi:2,5-dioxopentanoate dehydrogenase
VALQGVSFVGFEDCSLVGTKFHAMNPATGEQLDPAYISASTTEVETAAYLAREAQTAFGLKSGRERGAFLRHIATNIEASGEEVIGRAMQETGLPEARLRGELARTTSQLRLFAELVEEGSWVDARIDPARPDRKPLPRSDIRSMFRPLGPVVVFGASNFPLAFSVAGGDTASAFAGGNPVIVKAHPSHPGTSELVGSAIRKSLRECSLPPGVFSLLFDAQHTVGAALVKHPDIKAVGFTGSFGAGKALMQLASSRPEPIPCYAEMSSVNPLIVLPGALQNRAQQIAAGLYASFTLGAGQFCTKPGLVFLPEQPGTDDFAKEIADRVAAGKAHAMLNSDIAGRYAAAVDERSVAGKLRLVAQSSPSTETSTASPAIHVFGIDARDLLQAPELAQEVFGPSTLLVSYTDRDELLAAASALEGHLTATVHGESDELAAYRDLFDILEKKVGRILVNGYPTGVEVCHAMVHGGPFPATSDGRSTSVGTQAIFRFVRPVCYQDFPDELLPEELRSANPLGILRKVDGTMTREPVTTA